MPVVVDRTLTFNVTPDADGGSTISLTVTRQGARQLRDAAIRLVRQRFPVWSVGLVGREALQRERYHQMQIAIRQIAAQVQAGTLVLR